MRNPNFTDSTGNGQGSGTKELSPTAVAPTGAEATGFVADIEDLLTSTTSLTGDDLARAKARLMERVAAAKASVAKMSAATDGFVRARPWQAIGIAAVVGVLAGFVLARRN